MGDRTSNLGLYKPESGETDWGDQVNDNFTVIDSAIEEASTALESHADALNAHGVNVSGLVYTSDLSYMYDQAVAASIWTITHNKGYFLNVTVVDSAGTQVEGNIVFQDVNTIIVEFAAPFAGKAYLS